MEVKLESHEMRRVVVCTLRKLKLKLGRKVGEARGRKNTAHTRLGRRNRLSKENTEKKLKRFFFWQTKNVCQFDGGPEFQGEEGKIDYRVCVRCCRFARCILMCAAVDSA